DVDQAVVEEVGLVEPGHGDLGSRLGLGDRGQPREHAAHAGGLVDDLDPGRLLVLGGQRLGEVVVERLDERALAHHGHRLGRRRGAARTQRGAGRRGHGQTQEFPTRRHGHLPEDVDGAAGQYVTRADRVKTRGGAWSRIGDMASDLNDADIKMDATNLYREEIVTDRQVGTIRVMYPVKADGLADGSRKVLYVGETQVLTPAGMLPITFELEAPSLAEAIEKFGDGVKDAVERTIREIQELRREQASSIVIPRGMPPGGLGGGPGMGGPGGPRGKIQLP